MAERSRNARLAARLTAACALTLLAVGGLGTSPAGAVDKSVVGLFGESGSLGGQLNTPRGVAVNQATGDVYVADSANHRVTVFNAAGGFVRAFGQDVISGNGDTGYEICVDADLCKAGATGASTGGAMQNPQGVALDAAGNVYVSEQNKLRVQKFSPTGVFERAWGRDVVESGPGNQIIAEQQTITVKGDSGTFTLSFGGQTTAPLAHDVPASGGAGPTASIQNALNALSTIGGVGGSVTVTGPVDDTFTVIFGGDLEGDDVGQISIDDSGLGIPLGTELTCSSATAATTTNFRWLRNGVPIDGATASTYTTSATSTTTPVTSTGDEGAAIQCQVTKINANAGSTQVSNPRVVISAAPSPVLPLAPAANIASPTPVNPTVGMTLTCNPNEANWTGVTLPFGYQWYKNGAAVGGATNATYQLVAGDTPAIFQCAVTGSNASGSVTKVSQNRVTSPGIGSPVAPGGNAGSPDVAVSHGFLSSTATTVAGNAMPFEVCVAADLDICKSGVAGSGGGEFNSGGFDGQLAVVPTGGAAPNAGNVLVADNRNLRIQEFTPAGAFVRTFGYGVQTGAASFEVCAVATECQVGVAGNPLTDDGKLTNSVNRVVADADGNIYTLQWQNPFRVQKFTLPLNVVTPQGDFYAEPGAKNNTNRAVDIAVDPATNNVLIAWGFAAGATATCPNTGAPSTLERRIREVSPGGVLQFTHMTCAGISSVANPPNILGLATRGSTGEVYVASTEGESRLFVLDEPSPPSATFTSITDIGPNTATVNGFVNANTATDYGLGTGFHVKFKRSSDPTFTQQVPAVDVQFGKGTSNKLISQKLPFLEPGTSYDVMLFASKPFNGGFAESEIFTFSTPEAKPGVGTPSATTAIDPDTGEARAAFYGKVNPNGKATTYRFEYGTTTSYGTKVPVPDGSVGSGSADVSVAQFIDGLQPATTYHFRLLAKSINGTTASADRTFTTPPVGAPGNCDNEAVREQQGIADTVPDCRAYELVSPADKGSSGSVASFDGLVGQLQIHVQASQAGGAAVYPIQNGIPESTAGGLSRWHAKRVDEGWQQQQVSGPSLIEPTKSAGGDSFALPSLVQFASPDLSCAIVRSYNPLTEDTPQAALDAGMENLYRWDADDGSYELISNILPSNPAFNISNGALYSQIDASDDCKRVFFISHYRFIPGASGLYEWGDGVLRDAGVLPNGGLGAGIPGRIHPEYDSEGPQRAVSGGEVERPSTARWNAVSPDGRRFFFTAIANQGPSTGRPAIFMREVDENGNVEVVEVSASQTGVPTNGARFETASPDANKVVFRANYGIAATSSAGPTDARCGPIVDANANVRETDSGAVPSIEIRSCDLYVYDVETGELTDISADPNPVDPVGAQAQGAVAIDEDGSHVYFATLGQLIPGKGRTYAQNTAGNGSANIYLWSEGELSYVVTLDRGTDENADLFGGGNAVTASLYGVMMRVPGRWRAETSTDGSKLLFPASANLTGNAAGGGKKAYLYSAEAEELTCISCPPDGSPTLVTEDGRLAPLPSSALAGRESAGLLTRARRAGLTYRASSMSEDGSRVFFASLDALAPGAISGERNVYQWHQGKVSFLAIVKPSGAGGYAELFDVSADGKDVLIATNQQLVSEDKDTVSDLYNVRVDGGFLFEEPAPACQVDEAVPLIPDQIYCQGAASAQPGAVGLASPGFFGPGNPAPAGQPARRCNRQQVRRGKRCVAKRALARRACAKRKGKAKRRCIANQMRRLNRVQQRQWRQQQRRANANRGGAR